MTEIPAPPGDGLYAITSVLQDGAATSVNGLIPLPFQVVRLGLRDRVWELKQKGDFLYQFSIQNAYRYSGADNDKVIATIEEERNLLWRITYRENSRAYTIGPVWLGPPVVWTVASEAPDSEIVLKDIEYLPPTIEPPIVAPSQLFRFIPVLK